MCLLVFRQGCDMQSPAVKIQHSACLKHFVMKRELFRPFWSSATLTFTFKHKSEDVETTNPPAGGTKMAVVPEKNLSWAAYFWRGLSTAAPWNSQCLEVLLLYYF